MTTCAHCHQLPADTYTPGPMCTSCAEAFWQGVVSRGAELARSRRVMPPDEFNELNGDPVRVRVRVEARAHAALVEARARMDARRDAAPAIALGTPAPPGTSVWAADVRHRRLTGQGAFHPGFGRPQEHSG